MSKSALLIISSINSLRDAWNYINGKAHGSSRNSAGIDNQSINDFAQNLERNLLGIRAALISSGGYQFQSLKAHLIPKTNGKTRVICVPTVQDRIVQRAISDYLAEGDKCKLVNNVSYGFIRGRGVKKAANRAKNLREKRPWAYKTDITSFFDKVDRQSLNTTIAKKVRSSSLHKFLIDATKCEIYEPKLQRQKTIKKQGIIAGNGIRQGMPLSPFFSNLLLRDFDKATEMHGLKMVRYADDLIFFTKTEAECREIHEFCKRELKILNLDVPDIGIKSKTQIYSPDQPAEFLGVGLEKDGKGYSLRILKPQFVAIRTKLLNLSDMSFLNKEGITLSKLSRRLDGAMSGYSSAYDFCDNSEILEERLIEWKQELLTKIFRDGIGINLESLSPEQLLFLEIKA